MRMVEKMDRFCCRGVSCFDLGRTLDCGQCFRWKRCPDGFWEGVCCEPSAGSGRERTVFDFYPYKPPAYPGLLILYFGLDEDYTTLCRNFCTDPVLCRAVRFAPGIRLLRQDPWETLCSFYHQSKQQYPSHSRHYRAVLFSFGRSDGKRPAGFSHAGTALLHVR